MFWLRPVSSNQTVRLLFVCLFLKSFLSFPLLWLGRHWHYELVHKLRDLLTVFSNFMLDFCLSTFPTVSFSYTHVRMVICMCPLRLIVNWNNNPISELFFLMKQNYLVTKQQKSIIFRLDSCCTLIVSNKTLFDSVVTLENPISNLLMIRAV